MMLKQMWTYRGFILGNVRREFQIKYQRSLLGSLWAIIHPLTLIFIYTVIFSQLMQTKLPGVGSTFSYSIYLCAGVLTWGLFSEITTRMQTIFIEHANLLKKLNFPWSCLPAVVVCSAVINFLIVFGLFSLFLVVTGQFPGWVYWGLWPLLVLQVIFAVGLGICLAILNVFFRDVGQLFSILIQFWFWLTPIVYPSKILPESIRYWIELNPMTVLITAYQDILVRGTLPEWTSLMGVICISLCLCCLAWVLYRQHAGDMVDEL